MVIVKKRKKSSSIDQLKKTVIQFIELLETQNETEAVADLKTILPCLKEGASKEELTKALDLIQDAFEGEHELSAYTHARKGAEGSWTIADELYVASTSVLSLMNSIRGGLS